MKTLNTKWLLFMLIFIPILINAQTKSEGPWWPNKQWGAGDQAGGSNWITPEKIIKAMALVKKGKTLELGNIYERGMPLVGQRSYNIFIPGFPTHGPFGDDKVIYNDEFVAAEIGQVGTQFDGLGHPGRIMTMADGTTKEVFYNGFTVDQMKSPYGLLNLGIENIKPIITRGILIDVAGYKNVKTLPEKYEITLSDVKNTLARQGMRETDLEHGDALLFNLGWWRLWPDKKSVDGSPAYISREVVDWIISKKVCMVGSDASLDGPGSYVHTRLIMENGIFNLEFMNFKATENEKVYTFLFLFTPLRLKGATGSPGRPLAIY